MPNADDSGQEGFIEKMKDKLDDVKARAREGLDRLTKTDAPPETTPPPADSGPVSPPAASGPTGERGSELPPD